MPNQQKFVVYVTVKHEEKERAKELIRARLHKWFEETTDRDVIPKFGYPSGSLLFWNFGQEK